MLILHRYLLSISSLLFLQGLAVLLLMSLSLTLPSPWNRAVPPDAFHAWIHLIWAIAIGWSLRRGKVLQIGTGFSGFYLAFAGIGFLIDQPWGLQLGLGENLFHLGVGAIALGLLNSAASEHR